MINDSLLKVKRVIVIFLKRNNCVVKTLFVSFVWRETTVLWELFLLFICLVKEWFYSAIIGVIIDDSLLEVNRAIVIYLRNEERTHEF